MDFSAIGRGEVNWNKDCDYDYLVHILVNNASKGDSEVFKYDFGEVSPRCNFLKSNNYYGCRVYSGESLNFRRLKEGEYIVA